MMLAQAGPLTRVLESVATAVGAGIVLGSVAMGVVGMMLGWSRKEIGNRALTDGYLGGLGGGLIVFLESVLLWWMK